MKGVGNRVMLTVNIALLGNFNVAFTTCWRECGLCVADFLPVKVLLELKLRFSIDFKCD